MYMCRGVVVTDEEGDLVGVIVVVETHWKSNRELI